MGLHINVDINHLRRGELFGSSQIALLFFPFELELLFFKLYGSCLWFYGSDINFLIKRLVLKGDFRPVNVLLDRLIFFFDERTLLLSFFQCVFGSREFKHAVFLRFFS